MVTAAVKETNDTAGARLAKLRGYLEADAGNPRLLAEVIDLSLATGLRDDAGAALREALRLFPDDPHFLFRKASLCIAKRELAEAEATLVALTKDGAADFGVAYNLAYVYVLQSRFVEAATILREVMETVEAPAEGATLLVHALHHSGDLEGARKVALAGLARHVDDPSLAAVASLAFWDLGDLAQAKRLADSALAREPAMVAALVTLGSIALSDRNVAKAREYFVRALAVNPEDGRSLSGLGLAGLLAKDFESAAGSLEAAVKYMPGHVGTWHALAWCRIAQGRLGDARVALERALAIDRNFADTHGGLAVIAVLEKRPDAARESIARALGLDSRCISALYAESLLDGEIVDMASFQKVAERLLGRDLSRMLARNARSAS